MFDFWMHLKTLQTEEEANDPILHWRGEKGTPDRPFYDAESKELDPIALVEGFVEAGDISALLRMLEYHHPAVVEAVIDGLHGIGLQAIPYMLQAARQSHHPLALKLRIATAFSVLAANPDLRGAALRGLAALLPHPEVSVRRRALFLMVQHGAASIPALVPILVSGKRDARLLAGAAMVEIGEPQGFGILRQVAQRRPVEVPRHEVPALSRNRRNGREPMLGPYNADHLRTTITNEKAGIEERRMAIFRLAQMQRHEAAPLLRDILLGAEQEPLRSAAALSLGYIGDAASVSALTEARQAEKTQEAALALELIYGDVAFNTLLLALLHNEPATRQAAAYALGIGGGKRAVPHLMPLLRDGQVEVKRAAMVALQRIEIA